jgi:hypothetical protein
MRKLFAAANGEIIGDLEKDTTSVSYHWTRKMHGM